VSAEPCRQFVGERVGVVRPRRDDDDRARCVARQRRERGGLRAVAHAEHERLSRADAFAEARELHRLVDHGQQRGQVHADSGGQRDWGLIARSAPSEGIVAGWRGGRRSIRITGMTADRARGRALAAESALHTALGSPA